VRHLDGLARRLARQQWPGGALQLDLSDVRRIDTGGALLLHRLQQRLQQRGLAVDVCGLSAEAENLLELVRHTAAGMHPAKAPQPIGLLEAIGRRSLEGASQGIGLLAFIGRMALASLRLTLNPLRIRWGEIAHELGEAGHKALPIVGLLAFLLGIVITYQGGVQLRQYGASIFVADLVGLSMLRELAPILTAIIVAGRTGSAYTAQIGTMQVTEEIDALRVMGVNPLDLLVLPKVIALMIALPLLTVYADIMGVLGGMVMASVQLDIAYTTFIDRLSVALTLESYLVGIGKAPVFAAVIAIIGCHQGFQVSGSAESVGRRTTISVVQSILAVIVIDAAFSVAFSYLGI
jgi:phospholipid/cholesterol/gamma-HCH transport system permease protein